MSSVTVKQGNTYKLPSCSFTAPQYYHFGGWGTDANGSTIYQPDASVTINGDRVFYAIWVQSASDKVTQFIALYMHMDENNNGQCNTYFEPAKDAFNALDSEARSLFFSSSDSSIVAARNRLNAWAAYKGYSVNGENKYVATAQNSNLINNVNNNNVIAVAIATSLIAITSLCGLFFIYRRKKHN